MASINHGSPGVHLIEGTFVNYFFITTKEISGLHFGLSSVSPNSLIAMITLLMTVCEDRVFQLIKVK